MDDLGFCLVAVDVATSLWGHDMGGSKGGRDMEKWHHGVAEMGLS